MIQKFLVSDWNTHREFLMDTKQVLNLINDGNSQLYKARDLESDWDFGVTKVLNNYRIRRAA
jgi:hypothetical protein